MAKGMQKANLAAEVKQFLLSRFAPHFGQLTGKFESNPIWRRFRELGTELWLDTGSIDEASDLWTREFTALTTNNTLLNREVQTGVYDGLISEAVQTLEPFGLSQEELTYEIAFILNAHHALRLVEKFDATVSVELHTDLAHDVQGSVAWARRYHEICPERFIVKVPFTPEGLLATRILSRQGIPVNHTLGFSARQSHLIGKIARPAYVNVFLGRLNSFIADNDLGDGKYVGERATLAAQAVVKKLRAEHNVLTRQIAASMRSGQQALDLAGVDVLTMPPAVAREVLATCADPADIVDRTGEDYPVRLSETVHPESLCMDTLWGIRKRFAAAVDELDKMDLDAMIAADVIDFFAKRACGDVVIAWSDEQVALSEIEGKIPKLRNWQECLGGKHIGLDSLMNLAGLNSFAADQKAMDARMHEVLVKT